TLVDRGDLGDDHASAAACASLVVRRVPIRQRPVAPEVGHVGAEHDPIGSDRTADRDRVEQPQAHVVRAAVTRVPEWSCRALGRNVTAAAGAAIPCPWTQSGSGPSRAMPVKNLAAMHPPRHASHEPHDAQAPALPGRRSSTKSSESRHTEATPPAVRTDPARNWSWIANGHA